MSPILRVRWTDLLSTLQDIGLNRMIAVGTPALAVLRELGYVAGDPAIKLEAKGLLVFRTWFVLNDDRTASEQIKLDLLSHPVVALVVQVFFGRGPTGRDQLSTLLVHHGIMLPDGKMDDLGPLLGLLSKFGVIKYNKRAGAFVVESTPLGLDAPQHYFVDPSTPYSNIRNLRRILSELQGTTYWLDKHFRKEGLEILIDALDGQKVSNVTIVSGDQNVTVSAKQDFQNARTELGNRGIALEWRVCTDQPFLSSWHDRWLVGSNFNYNIPPVLSIIRGQQSEMIRTTNSPDVSGFLSASKPLP